MLVGVLMLVITGLSWSFVGVILSSSANEKLNVIRMYALQMLVGSVVAFWLFADRSVLITAGGGGSGPLALLMVTAGVVNASGLLTMRRAMRIGHHGITWAIGQSALVIPFLAGVAIFGEPLTLFRLLGVLAILVSLALYGQTRSVDAEHGPSILWIGTALLAFGILGLGQTLISVPSHTTAFSDTAGLRIPLMLLGNGLVYLVLWLRQPSRLTRYEVGFAGIGLVIGLSSQYLLFVALDILAAHQGASIGFPVAAGTCILGFIGYSAVVMKEPMTKRHVLGVGMGLLGIVLVSL